jgi:hypothetical protein
LEIISPVSAMVSSRTLLIRTFWTPPPRPRGALMWIPYLLRDTVQLLMATLRIQPAVSLPMERAEPTE